MNSIEVCFSPSVFDHFNSADKIVVVVDILRATSVICTMLENGAKEIIPVRDIEEAKAYKQKGYLVVAERNGAKLDFADFGNSPFYFTPETVAGKTIVYSTTNGTNAITVGKNASNVAIGSFLNFNAILKFLLSKQKDILILCAGWKGRFSMEDALFAGALASELIKSTSYETICDSTHAAMDLWNVAKKDMPNYLEKVAQRHRLRKLGLDNVIGYCFSFDQTDKVPILEGNRLVAQ
ncbi:MAG: 2-phosphosulfolactate phosphatase [Bacteroidales bacterium]